MLRDTTADENEEKKPENPNALNPFILTLGFNAPLSAKSSLLLSFIYPLLPLRFLCKEFFNPSIDEFYRVMHRKKYGDSQSNFWAKEKVFLTQQRDGMKALLDSREVTENTIHHECTFEQRQEMGKIEKKLAADEKEEVHQLNREIQELNTKRALLRHSEHNELIHIKKLKKFLKHLKKEIDDKPWRSRCIILMNNNELAFCASGQRRKYFFNDRTWPNAMIYYGISLSVSAAFMFLILPYVFLVLPYVVAFCSTFLMPSLSLAAELLATMVTALLASSVIGCISAGVALGFMELMLRVKLNVFNKNDRATRFDFCPFSSFSPALVNEFEELKKVQERLEATNLYTNLPLAPVNSQTTTFGRVYAKADQSLTFFNGIVDAKKAALAYNNYSPAPATAGPAPSTTN